MINHYLENLNKMYDHVDAVMITDKSGIIEYSVIYNNELKSLVNDGFVGKHVLDVYPTLTEETSNHFRVINSGEPILNERQELEDAFGRRFTLVNSTFPLDVSGEIIGTIEISIIVSSSENEYNADNNRPHVTNEGTQYNLDDIITASGAMVLLKERVKKISNSDSPVLIYGETGTGKELFAQSIHNQSKRKSASFISVNCAAIPDSLVESIFFGAEAGSYTGAKDTTGILELADGGTLFLDELNSMGPDHQSKLLRAIEEKKIRKIGGKEELPIDVRYISAMNANPFEEVRAGTLRQDLYYRLNVIQMEIPPLRKRPEDIKLLARYFMDRSNQKTGKNIKGFSSLVEEVLLDYYWAGNVRELKNAIESAVNMCEGDIIGMNDLPEHIFVGPTRENTTVYEVSTDIPLKEQIESFEKRIIQKALSEEKNISQAAKKLGLTRQAFQYKIDKYQLM